MERKKTASAYVLDDQNKLLCVFHKKFGKWVQPGGHIEGEEDPLETARREVYEETGIHIEFLIKEPIYIAEYDTVVGKQLDYQYVAIPLNHKICHNIENKGARFWSLEDLKKIDTVDDLIEMYQRALSYREKEEYKWTKELLLKRNSKKMKN